MNIPVLLVVTWVLASEPALLTDVAMLMAGVEMKWKPKVSNIHSYVLALARTVQGHCASGIAPWPEPRGRNMVLVQGLFDVLATVSRMRAGPV